MKNIRCPKCGHSIKAHANGTKGFRELSPEQMKASIAREARSLNEMSKIYQARVKAEMVLNSGLDNPFANP